MSRDLREAPMNSIALPGATARALGLLLSRPAYRAGEGIVRQTIVDEPPGLLVEISRGGDVDSYLLDRKGVVLVPNPDADQTGEVPDWIPEPKGRTT